MPRLRLDLHTHLKVSKRTPLQAGEADRFAAAAAARGLDGFAITEHFHAPGFWEMYDEILADRVYRRGRFEINGVLAYSGAELTLDEAVDLVILAPLHELRALDRAFRLRLSRGYHPTSEELLDAVERLESPALISLAHPVGHTRCAESLGPSAFARLLDSLECNARFSGESERRELDRLASRHALPLTAGSDAHVDIQVGAGWTEIDAASDGLDDIAAAIRRGRCAAHVAPDAPALCRAGRDLKTRLKADLPKMDHDQPEIVVRPLAASVAR